MDPSDLYGLPLERFTAERNALAKELRQSGQRDEAARVSKLRKPSATAWAVNQLVRTQRRGVDEVFSAGSALAAAQSRLVSGKGDPASLREAVEAERAAVDALVTRAGGLLSAQGGELSAARLEQVRETLHAAALDDEARAQVSTGCLERELRHVGLGSLSGGGSTPRSRPAGKGDQARKNDQSRKDDQKKKRAAEAAAARKAAAQAERRGKAQARLRDAEKALSAAQRALDEAARERDRAQRALDELG